MKVRILIFSLLITTFSYAGIIELNQRISTVPGTPVVVGNPSATKTIDLSALPGTYNDPLVSDLLTFGVNHQYADYFGTAMNVQINILVQPYDNAGSPLTAFYTNLTIDYDPLGSSSFTDRNAYRFTNAYKFDFTITAIKVNTVTVTTLPGNLYLDGNIAITRYYDFAAVATTPVAFTALTLQDINCDGINDEVLVTWPTTAEAEEYQLEWTFVNNYNGTGGYITSGLDYNFRGNATRITTVFNSYRIPLLFDHGYVAFRVRAVGRDMSSPDQYIFGVWNTAESGDITALSSTEKIYVTTPHEAALNWQVTTTFAEEGKKKEVVTYFDGSLRSRQIITRINSDENVIIGETYYDSQGRPAVTALPAPTADTTCSGLGESSLHYYPGFNKNTDGSPDPYSRADFDIDDPMNACDAPSAAMSTTAGASEYYSPSNPDMSFQQAYVPDAEGFPFSRVEYTPDNTGRIRRQGGVGDDFQVGTGHESKYYYGQPNQLQLDRLFGSEAGDAAHYKENVVIDPNGQASVSYLDQEGRVIATSLAGDPGAGTLGLSSESGAVVEFVVDLFAKDANGNSNSNTQNADGNAIVFNTQLLVPYAADYTFDYNITVDTLDDPCLDHDQDICFSCVYDLRIEVRDECGALLNSSIDKHIGHFTDDDPLTFTTECLGSPYTHNENFTLALPVGNYTVSKILTVNEDAVQFYLDSLFLDSAYNTCLKTLHDFQEEYLALVDTSDCYIDCETCVLSLGDRDEFVATGKGTALEYDVQVEKCRESCKVLSPCDASYKMMLADVSPGGQYAQYYNTNTNMIDVSAFPLSVLNSSNILPYSVISTADWHNPLVEVNATNYAYYLEEDGSRSIVNLSFDGVNYLPDVVNTGMGYIFQDPTTGVYYTYPENLLNLSDFMANWKPSWARSLVQYHPEYCYYIACHNYSQKQLTTDVMSSDEFDNLLRSTNTFADAVTAGFIKTTYASIAIPNDRLEDWFTFSSTKPYDPFVTNSGSFGSLGVVLQSTFNTYRTYSINTYSMLESAATAARCGSVYGLLPGATCMDFGKDFITGGPAAINDSIRDLEWNTLKSFYLSAKWALQNQFEDESALACGAVNDCIGNIEDFNPAASGMIHYTLMSWATSPFLDPGQPCSISRFGYYAAKQKRFPDQEDLPQTSAQDAAYQLYLMTGQCPLAYNLQELLTVLAGNNKLDESGVALLDYPQYNALFLSKYNFTPAVPITDEGYEWTGTDAGATLDIVWTDPNNADATVCTLQIDKTGTSISAWDDILGFKDLVSTGTDMSGNYTFSAFAIVQSTSLMPYSYEPVTGFISCLKLDSCLFPESCQPNQLARDLSLLMTALAVNGDLTNSSVDIESSPYVTFVTPRIRQAVGTTAALEWTYDSGNNWFKIKDPGSLSELRFHIIAETPTGTTYSNIVSFTGLTASYENIFEIDGLDNTQSQYVHFRLEALLYDGVGVTGISMGDCGHPEPMGCNENEHHVRRDLEKLLNEKLPEITSVDDDLDLFASVNMTPLLASYLPEGTTTTSSEYDSNSGMGYYNDTLTFTIEGCNMMLWHADAGSPDLELEYLVSLTDLVGIGSADAHGNYHDFMAVATYNISSVIYTDTLFGTSCWPIKNCSACPDTGGVAEEEEEEMVMSSEYQPSELEGGDEKCEDKYHTYLTAIHNYNTSAYAIATGFYLDTLYYTYLDFVRANLCPCISAYLAYLAPFITEDDNEAPPPLSIDAYSPCHTLTDFPQDTCKASYAVYYAAVLEFNKRLPNGFEEIDPYEYEEYTTKNYCLCLDEFLALLDAIKAGLYDNRIEEAEAKLDYGPDCVAKLLPPCKPDIVLDTFVSITVPYTNPCVEYKINTALANAQHAYDQYIDSLSNSFADRYRNHCLAALETFTEVYDDKEYHYTLYYYDQAGNLVKTVPPEGVEFLNFTDSCSSFDMREMQVIADRTNGTHTVFMQHRMATHYEYNSLNQLVRQSMPDQDNMDIWETTLPNGLDSRLQISSTQFVNETRGYLCGTVNMGGGLLRGMVYVTNDGGTTWQRFGGEVGATVNKLQWLSSTVAYAVGDNGTVLKTVDATNWDMLNTFPVTIAGSSDITKNLNDLYFTTSSDGVMVGNDRLMIYTTNGGSTFTMVNLNAVLPSSGDDITSISYDGTNYFITVAHDPGGGAPLQGLIFTATSPSGTWTQQTSIATAAALTKVQYYAASSAYACGADGTLLRTTNNGTAWNVVPTSTAGKFRDIYFRTEDEGIAIIENGSSEGELWKTFDKGITWTMLGDPGDNYRSFYAYENVAGGDKVVAVGDDGLVSRVIMQASTTYGVIRLDAPTGTPDLKASWAKIIDSHLWIFVAGDNGELHYTQNGTASTITWTSISTSISSPHDDFTRLEFLELATATPSNPCLSGLLLSSTGRLFTIQKPDNSLSFTCTALATPTPASNNFADLQDAANGTELLAVNNTDQKLYKITMATTAPTSASTVGSATTGYTTVTSFSVSSGNVVFGGSAGNLVYGTYTLPSTSSFADKTTNLISLALNVTEFSGGGGNVYAAGADGNIMKNTSGAWKILPANTAEDLYALNFNSTTTGLCGGENGTILTMSVGSTSITTTSITTNTTETVYDITRSSNAVYAAGSNGTLLTTGNITGGSMSVATISNVGDLKGVAFQDGSSTTALAVGTHAHLRWCYGQSSMQNKQVFVPMLRSIHFTDASNGYFGGANFTVRYTNDGGNTWNVVIPASASTTLGSNTPTVSSVFTLPDGTASIGGTVRYVGQVISGIATQLTASITSFPAGAAVNGIDFADATHGVLVGSASTSGIACTSTDGGASWTYNATTISTTALRSVKAFYRGTSPTLTYITGGTNGVLQYWDGSSYSSSTFGTLSGMSTVQFTDIFFHDDINGYVVGTKGVTLKSDGFTFNTTTGVFNTAGTWKRKEMDDDLLSQIDTTKMGEATISFSTRYNGFVGGSYDNTSAPTTQISYARNLRDESEMFATYFYYDKLGRIVLSQNSRQYNEADKKYSYSSYDALGRVEEAGEKTENTGGDPQLQSIFGTYVSNYYNPKVIDDANLTTWVTTASGDRKEVTHTYYDDPNTTITANLPAAFTQSNTRKRVNCVVYEDTWDGNDATYDHATHYTYDIHGNVNTLLQDNQKLATSAPGGNVGTQEFKRLDYTYDLISGNVNTVAYEKDSADAMHHRYEYDADNRITQVETSIDGVLWDKDAKYFYYAHGPLARTELGNEHVQGMDYAYTLQGWIKGVNSNTLDTTRDIGQDGNSLLGGNPNAGFAPDVMGYTLNYFNGDYAAIDGTHWTTPTDRFEADKVPFSDLLMGRNDLFNGNISAMVTTITDPSSRAILPQGMAYNYDQLNRLTYAKGYTNLDAVNNEWEILTQSGDIDANLFMYDANGNITAQYRADETGTLIDALTYNYAMSGGELVQNRLYHVNDAVVGSTPTDDIEDQGTFTASLATINSANNYEYDAEGRLAKDVQEEIDTIIWTVTGKVKEVLRTGGSSKKNLKFDYDAFGMPIAKHIFDASNNWEKSTYYVRDPQGNVMATYEETVVMMLTHFKLKERDIYGGSRLGMNTEDVEMVGAIISDTNATHNIGVKYYEMSNHLGNVLTVVSDKPLPIDWDVDGTVDCFKADIVSASDYYPFGAPMTARTFTSSSYRYAFNGKEKDDEMHGNSGDSYDFGARIYDARLGRWLSCDPEAGEFPQHSPYHALYCNPIVTIDNNGKENVVVIGSDCHMTSSDKNFLEAGLNQAIDMKNNSTENGESTTMVVFRGDYPQATLDEYEKKATENGITFLVVVNSSDIPNYINTKTVPGTNQPTDQSGLSAESTDQTADSGGDQAASDNTTTTATTPRGSDKITDFAYFGHGDRGTFYPMAHGGYGFGATEFDPNAFSSEKCDVLLGGCHQGAISTDYAISIGFPTVYDYFKTQVVVKGIITGGQYYCNWGVNENGQYGTGNYTLHGKRVENGTAAPRPEASPAPADDSQPKGCQ
jgi:RHS repeat-associated protein